jgi:hypothetical protein
MRILWGGPTIFIRGAVENKLIIWKRDYQERLYYSIEITYC